MTEKQWAETPEPGYFVSSDGEVWSTRTKRLLNPYPTRRGYLQVDLNGTKWFVSHLVYQAFSGKKPYQLVYLDGDIRNCAWENLERNEKMAKNFEPQEEGE